MQNFGGGDEVEEWLQVAFELQFADEAAHHHFGLLAVAVALLVGPVQVVPGDVDVVGSHQQVVEFPVYFGVGFVEVDQFQHAAEHFEHQRPKVEIQRVAAIEFEPDRGEELNDEFGMLNAEWGG